MDDARAERALEVYRRLIRVARYPEHDPAYTLILQDLRDADDYFRAIPHDQMKLDQFRLAGQITSMLMRFHSR